MKKRRVARIVASLLVLAMLCTAFGMVTFATGPTVTITEIQATDRETYWQMSVPYTVTEWTEGMQLAVLAYDVTSITENPESAAYSESTPIGYITQADAPNGEGTFSFRARMGEMEQGDTVAAFEGGDKILVKIGGSGVATPAAMLYTFPGDEPVLSNDASISGITLGGQAATSSDGTAYTVTVPEDTTIDQSAIQAAVTTTDDGASVSATQGADSLHWNITVTAEDGETTASYTLAITLSASAGNDADVTAMKNAIEAVAGSAETPSATFSYAQDSLSGDSDEEKKADLAGKIAATAAGLTPVSGVSLFDLSSNGVNVTANVTAYTEAVNGGSENWDGTPGTATATVTLTKGAVATATVTVYAALTPTAYTPSTAAQLTGLTVAGQNATIDEEGKTASVTLDYGTEVTQEAIAATVSTGANAEISGGGDNWTITVTAEDGTTEAVYTLTISYTENPDIAVVEGVKGAITTAFATATMNGSSATTATEGKAAAEEILADVTLNNVTAAIDGDGEITTAAVDATKDDLDGTEGVYEVTINLSKGDVEDSVAVSIAIVPATLQAIDAVQANVTAPVYGAAPADATLVDGSENYTIESTVWSPDDATFAYGKAYTATVTFTPNAGYIFVIAGDEGDGTSYTKTYEFEALAAPTYTITKGAETNGTFTVSPEGPVAAGTEITVTATPDTHYVVDTMTYKGSGEAVTITDNKFNMPAENVTVSVTFKENPDYTAVKAAADGLAASFDAIAQSTANTEETVKAIIEGLVAEDGLTAAVNTVGAFTAAVAGNADNNAGTNGSYTFTVTYTKNGESATSAERTVVITATPYAKSDAKALTAVTIAGVAAEINEEAKTVTVNNIAYDAVINTASFTGITVSEKATYAVTEGSGDTGWAIVVTAEDGTQATYTVTINRAAAPTYTITKGAETNGTFTVSPAGPVAAGTEITVTAAPAEDYEVESMTYTGSNGEAATITNNKFNMPAENVTVNVTFKLTAEGEDKADVAAAAETINAVIEEAGSGQAAQIFTFEQAEIAEGDEEAQKASLAGLIEAALQELLNSGAQLLDFTTADGVNVHIDVVNYTPAIAGTAADPDGTDGSATVNITLSKNGASQVIEGVIIAIEATPYQAPPIEGAQNVTLGLEATSDPAVFNIVLTPDAGQAITRFNAAEFTLVQNVTSGNLSAVVTAGEGLNIIPDAVTEGKYLVSLQVDAEGNTTPISGTTDEALTLGQITLSGIAEGSLGVTAAKAYMESEVNNEVVELNVTAAADANFSLQVETVPVTVRVDFINAVDTTKDADYTDMTVTVTSALGSTVYDLSSANAVAGLDDSKTAFEVETEMVAGIRYTVRLQGGGYRDASKTITPAAGGGETVYFWNNVMTEGQTLPDGETAATAENNKNFVAGDIQMDNRIDIYDLNAVVSYFGMIDMDQDYNTYNAYIRYDLNRDGKIDARDVAMVLVSWGE